MTDETNEQNTTPESEPENTEAPAPEAEAGAGEPAGEEAPAAEAAPAAGAGEKPYEDGDTIMVILSYFGILSLIPFFMFKDKRDNPKKEYVYWHARQGVALVGSVICIDIVLGLLFIIPIVGCLSAIVLMLFNLTAFVFMIIGMIKAFGGNRWVMPIFGGLAEKLN